MGARSSSGAVMISTLKGGKDEGASARALHPLFGESLHPKQMWVFHLSCVAVVEDDHAPDGLFTDKPESF